MIDTDTSASWKHQISEKINKGFNANDIDKHFAKARYIHTENDFYEGFKTAFSLGFYAYYSGTRNLIRCSLYTSWIEDVKKLKLTPQEALLKILDSFIGYSDKLSVKYNIVSSLFNIKAKDDIEAKKMVEYTIGKLKTYISRQLLDEVALEDLKPAINKPH